MTPTPLDEEAETAAPAARTGSTPPSTWRQLARRYWPELLALLGLSACFALLPGLGLLWLWQQDWLLAWIISSGLLIALVSVLRLLRADAAPSLAVRPAGGGASSAEIQAREAIAGLVAKASAEDLASRDSVDRLLRATVNAVAEAYSPGDEAAMLNFTVPEALSMTEQIARRLRLRIRDEFPVLRHLRLSWAAKSSGLIGRGLVPARGLATAWRIMRWADPLGAMVAEVRSLLIEQGINVLGREARAVLAAVLVRELGEVCIELYSGAYRAPVDHLPAAMPSRERGPGAPLRLLVVGQRNSGKSSLINAMLGRQAAPVGLTRATSEWTVYPVQARPPDSHGREQPGPISNARQPVAPVVESLAVESLELVEAPPFGALADREWIEQCRRADLILWVASAHRADRGADRRALKRMRQSTMADPHLRPVPLVLVLTHADRLEPPLEWQPPYDYLAGRRAKERSMARAMHAAATALDVDLARVVMLAFSDGTKAWNLAMLWEVLRSIRTEAQQKRLERLGRAEGLLKAGVDLVRSLPGAIARARHFLKR